MTKDEPRESGISCPHCNREMFLWEGKRCPHCGRENPQFSEEEASGRGSMPIMAAFIFGTLAIGSLVYRFGGENSIDIGIFILGVAIAIVIGEAVRRSKRRC